MIRINLLGVARPVARMAGPSEGVAPEAIIIPGALFVILALVTGFVYWYWTKDIDRLNKELQRQKNEQARLAGIMEQNKRYEQQLNQLQLRKDTIDKLLSSRVGPVQLMHTLGALVDRSNDLFLTSVAPKGDRLAVEGIANSSNAIADFIGALQKSGNFDDVQLRQSYQDNRETRVSFKFTLDCIYRQSAPASPSVPAGAPGQPAGATAPRAGV